MPEGRIICLDFTEFNASLVEGSTMAKCSLCDRAVTISPEGKASGFDPICTGCVAGGAAGDEHATPFLPTLVEGMKAGNFAGIVAAHQMPAREVAKIAEEAEKRRGRN